MANSLRVVYDNAADRATITASTTAGSLVPANMQTDYKSEVWRATGVTATLTITWTTGELVGMVAFPFSNLTATASLRVRGYGNATDTTPLIDVTGMAAAGADFTSFYWGVDPLGANAYSYGGGAYGSLWFPINTYQKIVIDITDSPQSGYIECSRLVCGRYWTPTYTAEAGATISIIDNSKQERTDAGDLRVDRGTVHKVLNFDLNFLTQLDRNSLWNILRGNGLFKSVYVSLIPESTDDTIGEQIFQVYGKLSKSASIKYQLLNQFSTQLEIEEI
jgi:hypothetical protein